MRPFARQEKLPDASGDRAPFRMGPGFDRHVAVVVDRHGQFGNAVSTVAEQRDERALNESMGGIRPDAGVDNIPFGFSVVAVEDGGVGVAQKIAEGPRQRVVGPVEQREDRLHHQGRESTGYMPGGVLQMVGPLSRRKRRAAGTSVRYQASCWGRPRASRSRTRSHGAPRYRDRRGRGRRGDARGSRDGHRGPSQPG